LWLFLLILVALPVFIAAVTLEALRFDPALRGNLSMLEVQRELLMRLFRDFQLSLLYPLIALVLMAGALREEIQNDTIAYLWLKPIPRGLIVLAKYSGTTLGIWGLVGLSVLATGALLAPSGKLLGALLLTAGMGSLAYGALFFALSVWVERPLLWGFAYVLGWEESFSRISSAASQLSVRHYAQGLLSALTESSNGNVSLSLALGVLLGLAVVTLAAAAWRFARMEFAGGEE
jgi:ABC-type transport system involved in multi-copper enzyme maturation permease subunit